MLMPMSLWISAKLSCHAHSQGGHFVFGFTQALVTAEPTPPPKYSDCDSLCVTMNPAWGGLELRQGSCIVYCLMVHFMRIQPLKHYWDNCGLSHTLMNYSSFFFLSNPLIPSLTVNRSPTDWAVMTSEWLTNRTKTPTKHNIQKVLQ